jgi:hypothetical protein
MRGGGPSRSVRAATGNEHAPDDNGGGQDNACASYGASPSPPTPSLPEECFGVDGRWRGTEIHVMDL